MIEWIIPRVLARASRPGYPSMDVDPATVDAWIAEAKDKNVGTAVCLLGGDELRYYGQLGSGGLLQKYRQNGLVVIHRPVPDHPSLEVLDDSCQRIASDFLAADPDLALLIHCSDGLARTSAVIEYLTDKCRLPDFRNNVYQAVRDHSDSRSRAHFLQVTRLALLLYDALERRHRLTPAHRSILWAAAMLHDIGRAVAGDDHAWRSGRLILDLADQLHCGASLMQIRDVATVAALHGVDGATERNPLGPVQDPISKLWCDSTIPPNLQILAGILRVADGLDYPREQKVRDLEVQDARILIIPHEGMNVSREIERAREKSGLLCATFGCEWTIEEMASGQGQRPPWGRA